MSNYHFYFGGGFQVFKLLLGPHRQQIKEPGTMNTEELQIARSSDMSHLILQIEIVLQLNFSADKKRNLGDQSIRVVAVVAKGSEKQAQNPDLCHRKIASNQRCMHRTFQETPTTSQFTSSGVCRFASTPSTHISTIQQSAA